MCRSDDQLWAHTSFVVRAVALRAQCSDDALVIEQEIERILDADHKQARAHHRFDGATFAHVNRNCEATGVPDRGQPQSVVPSISDNDNGFQVDAMCGAKRGQIVALEDIMIVGRDLVMQGDREAFQLPGRGFARV